MFVDRVLCVNNFVRFCSEQALIIVLVDCSPILIWNEQVRYFHCDCCFNVCAVPPSLYLYPAHYKACARCAFLLPLLSELHQNKTHVRANHSTPLNVYVQKRPPSFPKYADFSLVWSVFINIGWLILENTRIFVPPSLPSGLWYLCSNYFLAQIVAWVKAWWHLIASSVDF